MSDELTMSDCYDMTDHESDGRNENDISDENSRAINMEIEIIDSESNNFKENDIGESEILKKVIAITIKRQMNDRMLLVVIKKIFLEKLHRIIFLKNNNKF